MSDDAIDFSPLDPTADTGHFESLVARITAAARPELERRRLQSSVWWQMVRWRRPMLAAAAMIVLVSLTMAQIVRSPAGNLEGTGQIAGTLGIPTALAGWLASDTLPAPSQMLFLIEEE